MNDLARYFTLHPLEDPGNFLGTCFDPAGATAYRLQLRAWQESNRRAHRAPPRLTPPGSGTESRWAWRRITGDMP